MLLSYSVYIDSYSVYENSTSSINACFRQIFVRLPHRCLQRGQCLYSLIPRRENIHKYASLYFHMFTINEIYVTQFLHRKLCGH